MHNLALSVSAGAVWGKIWPILFAILFFGVIIALHEFGHFFYYEILTNEERIRIDEIFNNTEDPEWLSIALKDDYCTVRPKEYFAEFMMYYFSAGADMVKDLCPDTYTVIEPYFN